MISLAEMYRPITAEPFTDFKIEPCPALKPYVRCFWSTDRPGTGGDPEKLIIPDTCMDIIFYADSRTNRVNSIFCALDDRSYRIWAGSEAAVISVFGIRFYAWAAALFAEDTLNGSRNGKYPAEAFFSKIKGELEPMIAAEHTILGRKAAAERVLLGMLKNLRDPNADSSLLNAVYCMLDSGGSAKISDICGYVGASERKLERLFGDVMGVSPKTFSSLVRYQLLWQDMLRGVNVLDAMDKYGYTDQSHLLNDFKRRHLMYPKEAVELAKRGK